MPTPLPPRTSSPSGPTPAQTRSRRARETATSAASGGLTVEKLARRRVPAAPMRAVDTRRPCDVVLTSSRDSPAPAAAPRAARASADRWPAISVAWRAERRPPAYRVASTTAETATTTKRHRAPRSALSPSGSRAAAPRAMLPPGRPFQSAGPAGGRHAGAVVCPESLDQQPKGCAPPGSKAASPGRSGVGSPPDSTTTRDRRGSSARRAQRLDEWTGHSRTPTRSPGKPTPRGRGRSALPRARARPWQQPAPRRPSATDALRHAEGDPPAGRDRRGRGARRPPRRRPSRARRAGSGRR